jgi:hypothetical protein
MPDWLTTMPSWVPVGISALALIVSTSRFLVSWRMSRRTIDAQRVTAWIELISTGSSERFLATVTVKNPSHLDIKVAKLGIDLPDFRLGDLDEASVDDGMGNRVLPKGIKVKSHYAAMPLELAVHAGETDKRQFLIYQPTRSQKKQAQVRVMYWTMEPKRTWRILPVTVRTRPDL